MATVVGYFQSGPTHEGPNTKSVEVEDSPERGTSVDKSVADMYELGAFCVEVDGTEVAPPADEEAVSEVGDPEPVDDSEPADVEV